MLRKSFSAAVCVALGLTLLAVPASAKPAPVTKMKFRLDVHEVAAGAPVTGGVHAWTHQGHPWAPFPDAVLIVKVDGVEVGTVTTDADGYVDVSYLAEEGEHVMKIVFAGDALHKRAQRAQGFTVTPGGPDPAPAAVAPDAPVLAGSAPSVALVHLEWTVPASDGGSAISGYNVYRGYGSGAETLLSFLPADALSIDDTGVASGQVLYYVVTAVNGAGESVWSNEVEIGAL